MDSFKKGSSKINIPIAIRFNAHEDSVEDVTAHDTPAHSGSSSLPTSSSTAINPEPLSSSVGTWKMFKGRVSQAMGDMKSSKHSDSSNASRKLKLTEESDSELNNENDAIKKDNDNSKLSSPSSTFEKCKNLKKHESDKEINDVDKKTSSATKNKSDDNDSLAENVLRRRRLDSQQQISEHSDIESGVEITEEMTLSFYGPDNETTPSNLNTSPILSNGQRKINSSITDSSKAAKYFKTQLNKLKTIQEGIVDLIKCYKFSISFTSISSFLFLSNNSSDFVKGFLFALFLLCLTIETFSLIRKRMAPIPRKNGYYYPGADKDESSLSSGLPCNHKLRNIQRSLSIESKIVLSRSDENDIFEHKHVLSYTGWMNEISKYDATNYHSSFTKTVGIRLDGSMLRISSCAKNTPNKERIPRRAMWNEPFYNQQSALDDDNVSSTKKKIKNKHWKHVNPALYSKHRFFELLNCTVELLPHGIARKRHFSKKYPIQLTIRQVSTPEEKPEQETIEQNKSEVEDLDSTEVVDVADVEQATVDFLEKERLAVKKEAEEFIPEIDEIKKNTKFSKIKKIILFARCDREKEDWYRRFLAASLGKVYVTANSNIIDAHGTNQWGNIERSEFPDLVMINAADLNQPKETLEKTPSQKKSDRKSRKSKKLRKKRAKKENNKSSDEDWKWAFSSESDSDDSNSGKSDRDIVDSKSKASVKGLIMSSCASQGPDNYIKFMSVYQHFSKLTTILSDKPDGSTEDGSAQESYMTSAFKYYFLSPKKAYYSTEPQETAPLLEKVDVLSATTEPSTNSDEDSREQRDVDILWINVFLGRIIYSFLMNQQFSVWIHSTLQRKLDIIKLPVFMENICIKNINLGDTAPIFKNSQPPVCDERGLWFESDLTYRGLIHMTISVQLNLMKLKREEQQKSKADLNKNESSSDDSDSDEIVRNETKIREKIDKIDMDSKQAAVSKTPQSDKKSKPENTTKHKLHTMASICDSDAESIISSETESESLSQNYSASEKSDGESTEKSGGKHKQTKILRIMDRITASNFFQSATEISYVQKAMKNMSKNIRLCVELKGVEGRAVFNIPPPPTDRLWISFRTPPKLLISATPAVGETTFNWDIVTSTIENKLYEEILKILVYPNMVDLIIPVLGEPTYTEPEELNRTTTPSSP